jgi:hypothetical protein
LPAMCERRVALAMAGMPPVAANLGWALGLSVEPGSPPGQVALVGDERSFAYMELARWVRCLANVPYAAAGSRESPYPPRRREVRRLARRSRFDADALTVRAARCGRPRA